jgi:hypothetical protein
VKRGIVSSYRYRRGVIERLVRFDDLPKLLLQRRSPTDFNQRIPTDVPIFLYYGSEDETVPIAHANLYTTAIPRAVVRR